MTDILEKSVQWPLQVALYERLGSLLGGTPVYDDVPEATAYPYVTVGAMTEMEWGTKTGAGREPTVTLHTWSAYNGNLEVLEIHDAVQQSLTATPLDITGTYGYALYMRLEFATVLTDEGEPGRLLRHGVQRYRFLCEQS